ncbi:hypothetical protein [Corynebacterium sp.]|nr:hypothetical protein [Corynebacterium sp.]
MATQDTTTATTTARGITRRSAPLVPVAPIGWTGETCLGGE